MLGKRMRRAALAAMGLAAASMGMVGQAAAASPHTLAAAGLGEAYWGRPLTAVPTGMYVQYDFFNWQGVKEVPFYTGATTMHCYVGGTGLESLEAGQGNVQGGCGSTGGGTNLAWCSFTYARAGVAIVFEGSCGWGDGEVSTAAGTATLTLMNTSLDRSALAGSIAVGPA